MKRAIDCKKSSTFVAITAIALAAIAAGCSEDDQPPPPPIATATRTATATATQTSASNTPTQPAATPTSTGLSATATPTQAGATETPTSAASTETPTSEPVLETPTPTPTQGNTNTDFVGDFAGSIDLGNSESGTLFLQVAENGGLNGTFTILPLVGSGATLEAGGGQGTFPTANLTGSADLETGEFTANGILDSGGDVPVEITGDLPATPEESGSFMATVGEDEFTDGTLTKVEVPTPTPTARCGSADLEATFSDISGDYNGISTAFTADKTVGAVEQTNGFEGFYNLIVYTAQCTTESGERLRNININLFGYSGRILPGQQFDLGTSNLVYYGEEGSGGDRVWSSTGGTLFIDDIEGQTLTVRIVGATMANPVGAAAGSFTLDASGTISDFVRL